MKDRLKKLKTGFVNWSVRWRKGLPNVLIGAIMFMVAVTLGGTNLAGIAIAMMFIAAGLLNVDMPFKFYVRYFIILTLCASLGIVATINYPLCLIINFTVIFLTTYINGDEFIPKGYYMYGFILIMPQMQPLPPINVLYCILVCTVDFSLMGLFIWIRKKQMKLPKSHLLLKEGCLLLSQHLNDLKTSENENDFHDIVKRFSHQIYPNVCKQYGKMSEGQIWQHRVLSFLEQLNHLLWERIQTPHELSDSDKAYLRELGSLFSQAAGRPEKQRYAKLGTDLLELIDTHSLSDPVVDGDWRVTLQRFSSLLADEATCQSKKVSLVDGWKTKLHIMRQNFNRHSSVFRFSWKASILITACFAISYLLPFSRGYWLPMTVFSMLAVFHEDETKGASARLWGTILGMAIFTLGTEFIPGSPDTKMMILMLVCFSLLFSFTDPAISMLIGTQMSVGSLFPLTMSIEEAVGARFLIILASALIVWIGGQLIYRTEAKDALTHHVKSLLYHYKILVDELDQMLESGDRCNVTNELLLNVQMCTDEIEKLALSDAEPDHELIAALLSDCRAFHLEILHIFLLFYQLPLTPEQKEHFKKQVEQMKRLLQGKAPLQTGSGEAVSGHFGRSLHFLSNVTHHLSEGSRQKTH